MANQLFTFMAPDDERAFVRHLEQYVFEVYPRRIPPDWTPFRASLDMLDQFPDRELYLVASDIGPAEVDTVKRGPDKGFWRVDEVRSPVIFWERNARDEDTGELLSGQIWCELDVTSQTGRRDAAPDRFRVRYLEIENWVKKFFRKGDPKGFWIGPALARQMKDEEIVLREDKHWGRRIVVAGMKLPKSDERPRRG